VSGSGGFSVFARAIPSEPANLGENGQKWHKIAKNPKKIVENAVFALTFFPLKSHCNERRGL
jgi:hypothetical protein